MTSHCTVRVKTTSGLVMFVANKDTGDLTINEASAAKMTAAEAIYAKNLAQAHVCPADRYEFEIIPDPVEEYRKEKFRLIKLEAQADAVAERRACQRYAEENGGPAMTVKTPVKQSTYQGHVIWDADGSAIADCDDPEVARRIVACVNACAGVSTKELESGLPTINAKLDKINAIIDELGAKL